MDDLERVVTECLQRIDNFGKKKGRVGRGGRLTDRELRNLPIGP